MWGGDDRLRLVRTAREVLAPSPRHPSPTGLGPTVAEATAGMSPGRLQEILRTLGLPTTHDSVSAVAALTGLFTDRPQMDALLDEAPADALGVLDRLVWGPPYGEVTADPAPPVRWLRDRGLLLPTTARTVALPARWRCTCGPGGRTARRNRCRRPWSRPASTVRRWWTPPRPARRTPRSPPPRALLKQWNEGGPAVLRAGGLSVRDLKRTAVLLGVAEPVAAFWLELLYAAGLLAPDGGTDERYAPTPAYDEWLDLPAARRWARLAAAWLVSTRTPGLVGGQDAKGRTLSALGPDLDRGAAPEVRRRVLELLAALPPGAAPEPDAVLARLRWERPLRGGGTDLRARLATWTLTEAETLGVTGRGALSGHGRALLDGPGEDAAVALLAPCCPSRSTTSCSRPT